MNPFSSLDYLDMLTVNQLKDSKFNLKYPSLSCIANR